MVALFQTAYKEPILRWELETCLMSRLNNHIIFVPVHIPSNQSCILISPLPLINSPTLSQRSFSIPLIDDVSYIIKRNQAGQKETVKKIIPTIKQQYVWEEEYLAQSMSMQTQALQHGAVGVSGPPWREPPYESSLK